MDGLRRLAAANPIPPDSVAALASSLPDSPSVELRRRHRHPVTRRMALLAATGVAVLAAAPALALHAQFAQTIHDFLVSDAPPQAKTAIERIVEGTPAPRSGKPDEITLVVSTTGPEGALQLYKLHYTNGDIGQTIVDTSHTPPQFRGGVGWGPPRPLPAGQTLDVRGSGVEYPGRTPVYFDGIVDPSVQTVEVVYADGHTQQIPLANGYMLGWVLPQADGNYGDGTLIARDAQGNPIGRTDFCESGRDLQFRSHTATMPSDPAAACAIPPTPDPG
jgi:hypothetical protein